MKARDIQKAGIPADWLLGLLDTIIKLTKVNGKDKEVLLRNGRKVHEKNQ